MGSGELGVLRRFNFTAETGCMTNMRIYLSLSWALMFTLVSPLCSQVKPLTERLPFYSVAIPYAYEQIPYIVGVQILENTTPVAPFHPTRYDSQRLTRLYRVRAKVENVLRGDVSAGQTINIYFFIDNRNLGSSGFPMDFPIGTRQLFFLQKDYGKFRTIFDQFSNGCAVKILSGAHPDFKPNLSQLVTEDILNILLTRGVHVSDEEMENAIKQSERYRIFGNDALISKLQKVTQVETAPVAQVACSLLIRLGAACEPKPTKN